jgi:hypothetical protein
MVAIGPRVDFSRLVSEHIFHGAKLALRVCLVNVKSGTAAFSSAHIRRDDQKLGHFGPLLNPASGNAVPRKHWLDYITALVCLSIIRALSSILSRIQSSIERLN